MAELILTEAEKAATTWLELDDATIGKLVKKQALAIMDKSVEMEQITSTSAVMLLCGFAADMNADKSEYDIGGFTEAGESFGDWKVTVQRQSAPDTEGATTTPLEWMMAGDTGISSETIVHVMEGTPPPLLGPDVPYDAGDFGRCHRLLLAIPEYRGRLQEVADRYPAWVGIIREWSRLDTLYMAGDRRLFQEELDVLIHEGRLADGWTPTSFGWQKKSTGDEDE